MLEKSIYKAISKYDNIVVARHIGPDPDAICSQLALRDSIRLTFPKKNVYAVGLSVSRFKYFGHLDHIDDSTLEKPLLIVLDVPNISRIDSANIYPNPKYFWLTDKNLRRIRDILECFEREHSSDRGKKGKLLIKDDYLLVLHKHHYLKLF